MSDKDKMARRQFLRIAAPASMGAVTAACTPPPREQGSASEAERGEPMRFVAYVNAEQGIRSVVPDGWSAERPGELERRASEEDRTSLVLMQIPGVSVAKLEGLLLPRLGLQALPEPTGSLTTRHLAWELYACELDGGQAMVDLAMADGERGGCFVLLSTTLDEYEALHYTVYLRVVEAFAPLITQKEERASVTVEEASADVLVIAGEHVENEASQAIANLLGAELGLSAALVDFEGLGRADLQRAKLIVCPGGEAASIQVPERVANLVRDAVANGTGYIGICCGAFLASESSTMANHWQIGGNAFGIMPGVAEAAGGEGVWPFYLDLGHPVLANASVADRISAVTHMRFVGGTTDIRPSYAEGWQHWRVASLDEPGEGEVLGRRTVMTTTLFGRGRVYLSGPHPEARQETHPILIAAAEWCTGRSDPESDERPQVQAQIPARGNAGRPVACSAVGSTDPLGYPLGYTWDYGDGSPRQHRPEAIHVYGAAGRYTVSLTVTTGTRESVVSREMVVV